MLPPPVEILRCIWFGCHLSVGCMLGTVPAQNPRPAGALHARITSRGFDTDGHWILPLVPPRGRIVVIVPPVVQSAELYRRWNPMDYTLTHSEISDSLAELEKRRWLFDQLPIDPVHAEWFRHRAWIRTVHGTTKIEGNTLNDLEVEEVLTESASRFSRKDALEVLGSRSSLELVDEIAPDAEVRVGEDVIREIHRRVLGDIDPMLTPGQYRRGENRVTDGGGRIIFTTPPSGDVPELMRELGLWLRGEPELDLEAPVRAALAHLEFVAIHPFYDGNGRTSRALARLLLLRHGYAFDGLVSLDAHLDLNRNAYFRAIAKATKRQYRPGYDATPFVDFFLKALAGAADHVLARLRGLGEVMITIRREVTKGSLAPSMLDALAYAWINHSIRPADYIRITGRTKQSASRDLGSAEAAGYLEARGESRRRRYVVGPRLAAISPRQFGD